MNLESFFVKFSSYIIKMLIQILMDQLKGLVRIYLLFHPLSSPFDRKRRKGLLYLMIITNRTGDHARRFLFFEGRTVLKPALKFVTV